MFTESFKGVSIKFQGCFKEVPRVFQESFREDSRVFPESFKNVSRVFQGRLKCNSRQLLRGVQGYLKEVKICVKEVSMSLQGCFKSDSKMLFTRRCKEV